MVTIGNTTLPGVQTSVESASSTGVNIGAPGQIGLIGEADLDAGTAEPNSVEVIRTPVKARNLFGPDSQLTNGVVSALGEGAYPVFAVAPELTDVSSEDLTGLSAAEGVLDNAPVVEDAQQVSFIIDGTSKNVFTTYGDVSSVTVETDEAHYNPVTGDFVLDQAPSTSGTVDYSAYDYDAATEAMFADRGEVVDIVGMLTENDDAVQFAHQRCLTAANLYNFAVIVGGASPVISDFSAYSIGYDSSRIQLIHPSRDENMMSIVGAFCGLRARLGINFSPMFKRLQTVNDLSYTLSATDQADLISSNTVPIVNESAGARIVEDLTSVSDDNAGESAMRQVLHRLIVDYVTEVVNLNSEKYIGELHTVAARNSLRSNISAELNRLMDTNSITGFNVTVEEVDAMTASVDVGIDTVDPLRNIVATISAGQIE